MFSLLQFVKLNCSNVGFGLCIGFGGLGLECCRLVLGFEGQVLALALALFVKPQYINSNIQLLGLTVIAHHVQ